MGVSAEGTGIQMSLKCIIFMVRLMLAYKSIISRAPHANISEIEINDLELIRFTSEPKANVVSIRGDRQPFLLENTFKGCSLDIFMYVLAPRVFIYPL